MTETIATLLSFILLIPLKEKRMRLQDYQSMTRNALELLATNQNKLINERNECDEDSYWTESHWFWVTMYTLGIGTGAMGVFVYQALQHLN